MHTLTRHLSLILLTATCTTAHAAPKPCADLKAEIAAKLDEKGVKGYEITVVDADKLPADAKLIGSCEGGSKKLTLVRK